MNSVHIALILFTVFVFFLGAVALVMLWIWRKTQTLPAVVLQPAARTNNTPPQSRAEKEVRKKRAWLRQVANKV